jgi:IclR family pca regulon transcriptional regulator
MQDEELAYGLRSVAGPITDAGGTVIAGANLALPARDWSTQRIAEELRPVVLETCRQISALLTEGNSRS